MAKTSAWLFTILGLISIPPIMAWIESMGTGYYWWLFSILLLIVGITKLIRNYSYKKK